MFQGCTHLAKILLSLFNCYSRHLAIHHQIHSSFIQAPLPTCFQCQVRTYCTEKKKNYLTKYCQCKRQMWGNNISIFRFKGMNYEFLQDSTLKGEVKKWNWCKQDTKNSDLLWQMAFNNLPILKRLRYTKIWYLTLYKKLF